jgi:spore coat protein A
MSSLSRWTRRDALRLAAGAAIVAPLAAACDSGHHARGGGAGSGDSGGDAGAAPSSSTGGVLRSATPPPAPFRVPLPIPPALRPSRTDATSDYYEITQRPGKAAILPGLTTEVWGYDGIFPGPTIHARSGRRIVVRQHNELPVPAVVHLHGAVTPPEHDGYPTDLILPASGWRPRHAGHAAPGRVSPAARDYIYPLDQPAATLWYHDHRMDFTGPQVYRGLAGMFLIRDEVEDRLPLPGGERDVPLMICDRAFGADGSFHYPAIDPTLRDTAGVEKAFMRGVLGDVVLVNGAPWPYLEVSAVRYRLRILNASNARSYRLALDPPPPEGSAFVQVGSDVGLLERPIGHNAIEIAPAERFDVVVDFSAYPVNTKVTLINHFGAGATGQIMRFHVARKGADESAVPSRLARLERLSRSAVAATRRFRFAREGRIGTRHTWTINGREFDPDRVDARPRLGTTEIWQIRSNARHPVHLHMAHFQVLSRGGGAPGAYDAGWKDTINLRPGEQAEIIARFAGYRGRFMLHCHNLEHEDMSMMTNVEVT